MNEHIDHFMHSLNFQASKQTEQIKPAYIGYIKEYDLERGMVKVIDPLNGPETEDNNPGPAMISDWMPFGTLQAGITGDNPINPDIKKWGLQIIPFGGGDEKTFDKPTEQVLVINIRTSTGYSSCALMLYNNKAMPPGKEMPILKVDVDKGDLLYVNASGTTFYFKTKTGTVYLFVDKVESDSEGSSGDENDAGNFISGIAGGVHQQTFSDLDKAPPKNPDPGDIWSTSFKNTEIVAGKGILLQTVEDTEADDLDTIDPAEGDIDFSALQNLQGYAIEGGIILATGDDSVTPEVGNVELNAVNDILGSATNNISLGAGVNVEIAATEAILMQSATLTMTMSGTVDITAPIINIGFAAGAYQSLCTQAFMEWVLTHQHEGVMPGDGVTSTPNDPPAPAAPFLTESLKAS